MITAELEKRQERASRETLVIKKTDEGYRVHRPGDPARNYLVSGSFDSPSCTCPDFGNHRTDPDWRCKHVLAVLNHVGRPGGETEPGDDAVEREERLAIQNEGTLPHRGELLAPGAPNGLPSQMLLKRSVSPDGRIDSLSVEFSCPLEGSAADEITRRARRTLELQSEIVEGFLTRGDAGEGDHSDNGDGHERAAEARMLRIGGLDTRYGRRLFINVQVNGEALKLFGSKKQLAEAIEAAGFPRRAERVEEGIRLDLPCRVTTKPSEDGRYENIDRVFPAALRRGDRRPTR